MSRGTGVQKSWGTSSQWCQWMKNASKASLSKEWFESQSGISMRFKNAESCCHSERIKLRRIWGIAPSPNRQPIPTRQEAWGNGELTRFCDAVKHKQKDSEREHIHHLCCSIPAFDSSVSVTFDWWCLSLPHSRFLRHLAVEIEMGWMCFSFKKKTIRTCEDASSPEHLSDLDISDREVSSNATTAVSPQTPLESRGFATWLRSVSWCLPFGAFIGCHMLV